MTINTRITWIILLLLTLLTAGLASMDMSALLILIIVVVKVLLVSFQFMDLKKAHIFWKIALTVLVVLFTGIFLLVTRL